VAQPSKRLSKLSLAWRSHKRLQRALVLLRATK